MKPKTAALLFLALAGCTTTVTTFADGKTIKTSTPAGVVAMIVSGFTQGAAAVFEAHNRQGLSK